MTRLKIILFLLITSAYAQATVCVDKVFKHNNISLYLCQNHSNYNETRTLLFKARAQQLDIFIADLIGQGKLENKKVEIQLWDGLLTFNHIMVSQNQNGYYITYSGFPTFQELAKIINYFAQPDWSSFVYNPEKVTNQDRTRENFTKLISQYALPNLDKYISKKIILWQSNNITLTYNNDKLSYYDLNQQLKYKPTSNLPTKIRDRYIFFQIDSFFVYQDGKEILQFETNMAQTSEDYSMVDVHPLWVNIGIYSEHCLYSYSYERNRFYKMRK